MTRIAITGHRALSPDIATMVDVALRELLAQYDPAHLIGVSCLADSTDQIFARAVLDAGGRLEVVLVDEAHRDFPDDPLSPFSMLLAQASTIRPVPLGANRARSWTDAGSNLLRDADLLVAVWDGRTPTGTGSTADVAIEARRRGLTVQVIWPVQRARAVEPT